MRNTSFTVLSIALAGLLAGCTTSPPEAMKPEELPKAFTAPQVPSSTQDISTEWWKSFFSSELDDMVSTAAGNNLDIAAAVARVQQAQAQTGEAWANLFPAVDLSASAKRQGTGSPSTTFNTFGLGGNASYELDFWGETLDNIRAARESARSAIYARDVVALTTTADVANTYLAVLALRQRVTIAKQNIDAAKRILAITMAKYQNGTLSNLELAQQQAQLASQEAQIPALEEQEREQRYALAILLGRAPEGFDVKAVSLEGIATPPVAPGLPASLLQRRPDIAEAEASLLSAHANVDAARAAFLPAIGLTGQGGYSRPELSDLISPLGLEWSVGASLLQTIFDGGKLSSQSDYAKAKEAELVADYRKTVLSALSDVETELGSVSSYADQERFTADEVKNAAEAFRISELQYREGVGDPLAVLQTEQTLFSSEDQLVQIKLARLEAGIGLYRALGGGWTVAADKDVPTRNEFMPLPLPSDVLSMK
jgi:NodT family efflux transporter outer membrane factor (OMF) lipoprotein